jgi:maltooligosyltrehalose trehalohydrolase
MHTFEVWAPAAESVSLAWNETVLPMKKGETGWWFLTVQQAEPGDLYAFGVDGGDPRPDPRSMALPEGVHGRSAVVDHSRFGWSRWSGFHLPGSVLYELHIGTFTDDGTFDSALERLPHLVTLGVDAVEVMPIASFDGGRGWGYDGVGLYAPHVAYGGPDGFKRFVDGCHRAGIGVILDVVYNHLGPSGNYLPTFGPYFSDAHHTNWGNGVNLDGAGSDQVRRYFIDNAIMWMRDYHVDGLRLDAVHALADQSAVHFLEQLSSETARLSAAAGRPLWLIAESDLNDPRFVRPPALGGYGLDASWADEWHHAVHAWLTGETDGYYSDFGTIAHVGKALQQAWVYDGVYSAHRERRHGRPPTGLDGTRFVVSAQNHDQIGNRATGDRLSSTLSDGRLRVAAGLLLTGPFVPMLFQGEEWAASTPWRYFTDFADAELGRAVTEGRRSEFSYFGWDPESVPDPQDEGTFLASKLDWASLDEPEHASMFQWYRDLIALRRLFPELADPMLPTVSVDRSTLFVARGPILVVASLEGGVAEVGAGRLLAASDPAVRLAGDRLHYAPESLAVVARDSANAGERRGGRRTATSPPTSDYAEIRR